MRRAARAGSGDIATRLSLAGSEGPGQLYEIAGERLSSDLPIEQLAPFARGPEPSDCRARPVAAAREPLDRLYAGLGWVGGRLRRVESWRGTGGYLLRVAGAGSFEVRDDGGAISLRRPLASGGPSEAVVAAALGPCLVLALALRDTWCLHASAAALGQSAVAFAGESGSGKSTLAAALAERSAGWRRLGDDLLPLRLADEGVVALPRYPQPGAPELGRLLAAEPEATPLTAVHLLRPGAADAAFEARRLSRRQATLALVHQSVAAKLFDRRLQARHLEACAELSRRLPVVGLRFPRRPEALPAMIAAIGEGAAAQRFSS